MKSATKDLLGQTVGHIRIFDVLGEGGMGAVYAGFDDKLQRRVAVKAIRSEFRLNPEAKARFLREARILSGLKHSNICTVHDFIEGEDCDYLILELVDGESLREAMDRGLDQERAMHIARELLGVLVSVHERGIVHRDLKPENVMLTAAGEIKVLDFGLARSIGEQPASMHGETVIERREGAVSPAADATIAGDGEGADDGHTMAIEDQGATAVLPGQGSAAEAGRTFKLMTTLGTVIGTAGYMSPEQARGEPATAACDMYSLGLILQEMFTGSPAFPPELSRAALIDNAAKGRSLPVKGLSLPLTELIERLKALEPARRPSSVDAAERLRWIFDAPRRRRRRTLVVTAWLVLVLFAGVMALQAFRLAQSRKRERLASRFGAEVQQIESLMRFAHLMPLHDLSADKARVRSRMEGMRERLKDVGEWGVGPGLYAIGRGHLALGEYEEAQRVLQESWDRGYHEPEAAYALGLALGKLYQAELDRLRTIGDRDERLLEKQRIEVELREPAARSLRLAGGVDVVAAEYVEGLLALYEGRYEDALALAGECSAAADWFYECGLLEGNAWFLLALERRGRGESDGALEAFDRADSAYRGVTTIAGSDARGYGGICKVWTRVLEMRLYDVGGDLRSVVDRALKACDQALVADPERTAPLASTVSCNRILAEARLHRDEDPTEALEAAKRAAERLVDLAPHEAVAHQMSAHTLMFSSGAAMMRGNDGAADAAAAVASLERAVEIDPGSAGIQLDLGFAQRMAAESVESGGGDPFPLFERAAAAYRRSAELKPSFADPHNNLGDLDIRWAELAAARDEDPIPRLDQAIAHCTRALEIKPDHMFATANRGIAHLRKGQRLRSVGFDPEADFEAALVDLAAAAELNADHPSNYLYFGEAARDLVQYRAGRGSPAPEVLDRGFEAVRKALERVPDWPPALALREDLVALR